ncbi:hypothetical protein ABIE44_000528 [Marmoricola sp. OAE513]|uniref:hypothetical protein n=1 Tax=Marmoricola sp. OAE513 TaxID=2817894 RepID=UPI001AEB03B4
MEEHLCASCGGVLPPTGTYCLACDTPVADAPRGLSVGTTEVVAHGRPLLGVGVILAVVLVLGGVAFGIRSLWISHLDGNATAAAIRGTDILVHSENGSAKACVHAETAVIGDPKTVQTECDALVGTIPGAVIRGLHATAVHRNGQHATVVLRGTWQDDEGSAPYSRTVKVRSDHNEWELIWDGKPVTAQG